MVSVPTAKGNVPVVCAVSYMSAHEGELDRDTIVGYATNTYFPPRP